MRWFGPGLARTIEARIGKALLSRSFRLVLESWRDPAAQALPLAPVSAIANVTLVEVGGATQVVAPARYRLRADRHRPRLEGVELLLPTVPMDGQVEVVFTAGFGTAWADLPADLAQAVLLLAAQFYETRHEAGGMPALPVMVQALIEKWRNIRVLGGGAA